MVFNSVSRGNEIMQDYNSNLQNTHFELFEWQASQKNNFTWNKSKFARHIVIDVCHMNAEFKKRKKIHSLSNSQNENFMIIILSRKILKLRCIEPSTVYESPGVNIHACYFTQSLVLIKRFLKLWDATNLETIEYISEN